MHVLITNHALRTRGGSELYTRDLAIGLRARGVTVSVYSPLNGEVAAEIARQGILVCSDLDEIRGTPDLIHGHHDIQTIAALCRFPTTPAIFVCHGVDPWQEMPPIHPAIARYYAVGPLTADHIRTTARVSGDQITIIPNWVDTDRVVQKASLSATPREALVVSNAHYDKGAIEVACQSRGIRLRRFGRGFGQSSAQLEDEFCRVDLVFAVGRTALEAMAAGYGVILANGAGVAELLLPENFDS